MSKPIHDYLDLDVVNNNLNSNTNAPQLRFEENRNTPFLDGDCSEYFCSIVRFSIQTGNSLPIFIPRVITGQGDINLTVYGVMMNMTVTHRDGVAEVIAAPAVPASPGVLATPAVVGVTGVPATTTFYGGVVTQLIYTSPDLVADVPAKPYTAQDMSGTYYYHYNIKDIVAMFNRGLADQWYGIGVSISSMTDPDLKAVIQAGRAPYFEYDYDKCRLVLNIDQAFCSGTCVNGTYAGSLFFNTRFYELLSGLPCIRQSRTGNNNYQFSPDTTNTKVVKDSLGVSHTMYQTMQEASSLAMWNPIASVVFCTGMLPILWIR